MWSLRILSLFLMVGIPLYMLYKKLFVGQETKSIISFSIAFVIGAVGIILFFSFKTKIFKTLAINRCCLTNWVSMERHPSF